MKKKETELDWLRLDNAARIYPAIISRRITSMFRLAVILKDEINPDLLKTAVDNIAKRFPYYRVRLKSGFFWEYLEESNENISVSKERLPPCQMPRRKDRGYLFRILYFKKRIAVEFSHIITDGTGAMEFLKALLYEYLVLVGHDIDWPDVLKKEGEPGRKKINQIRIFFISHPIFASKMQIRIFFCYSKFFCYI